MSCLFCTVFWNAKKSNAPKDDLEKKCVVINAIVDRDTPHCNDIDLNEVVFFCRRNHQQYSPDVCLYRQKKKHEDCAGCSDGKELLKVYRLLHRREK